MSVEGACSCRAFGAVAFAPTPVSGAAGGQPVPVPSAAPFCNGGRCGVACGAGAAVKGSDKAPAAVEGQLVAVGTTETPRSTVLPLSGSSVYCPKTLVPS